MDERRALGRAIRVLRAERGVSQEAVEHAGGLGQNALTRVERGSSSASFDSLVGIAEGLGVSLGELVGAYEAQLARQGATLSSSGADGGSPWRP
jgi:transcriptional regulator with XRE-family HTH domain